MRRRRFLGLMGLSCATLYNGGIGSLLFSRCLDYKKLSYYDLPEAGRALYHESFLKAFPDLAQEDLIRALYDRGICSRTGFSLDRIRGNAAHDSLIEFDDFIYTKLELLLYAAVARLHASESEREEQVPKSTPGLL